MQENLNRGLAMISRAVATRTTLPITQNVLMETDQSRLKLSATNLELAITTWVGAMVEEEAPSPYLRGSCPTSSARCPTRK